MGLASGALLIHQGHAVKPSNFGGNGCGRKLSYSSKRCVYHLPERFVGHAWWHYVCSGKCELFMMSPWPHHNSGLLQETDFWPSCCTREHWAILYYTWEPWSRSVSDENQISKHRLKAINCLQPLSLHSEICLPLLTSRQRRIVTANQLLPQSYCWYQVFKALTLDHSRINYGNLSNEMLGSSSMIMKYAPFTWSMVLWCCRVLD